MSPSSVFFNFIFIVTSVSDTILHKNLIKTGSEKTHRGGTLEHITFNFFIPVGIVTLLWVCFYGYGFMGMHLDQQISLYLVAQGSILAPIL